MAAAPSYVHGASPVPLLGTTIGENLRRTVERFSDREALVVRQQGYRATYGELWEQVGQAARGLMGPILVNINPAYRTAELEYALNQSGISFLLLARAFRTSDYAGMLGEVRG